LLNMIEDGTDKKPASFLPSAKQYKLAQ